MLYIRDIINCNLEKNNEILIVHGINISDTTAYQMVIQVLSLPDICHYLGKTEQMKQELKMKKKHWYISSLQKCNPEQPRS